MPNLWTKAIQSINEKFSGPRTKDVEIKRKYEESQAMDLALKKLKTIISNFSQCFEAIMKYNREISEAVFVLYDNSEEYKDFAYVLNKVHVDNNKLFKQINSEILDLNEKTRDWPLYFAKVKELNEERENSRRTYDHYERKLELLIYEKESKEKKNVPIRENFLKKVERNEEKFLKAREDYLNKCIYVYDTYESLLNDRFNLMNQPLLNLFFIEMKLYENFSSKYMVYKDLEDKLTKMRTNFAMKDRKIKYDPTIYMKNPYLESKLCKKSSSKTLKANSPNSNENNFGGKVTYPVNERVCPNSCMNNLNNTFTFNKAEEINTLNGHPGNASYCFNKKTNPEFTNFINQFSKKEEDNVDLFGGNKGENKPVSPENEKEEEIEINVEKEMEDVTPNPNSNLHTEVEQNIPKEKQDITEFFNFNDLDFDYSKVQNNPNIINIEIEKVQTFPQEKKNSFAHYIDTDLFNSEKSSTVQVSKNENAGVMIDEIFSDQERNNNISKAKNPFNKAEEFKQINLLTDQASEVDKKPFKLSYPSLTSVLDQTSQLNMGNNFNLDCQSNYTPSIFSRKKDNNNYYPSYNYNNEMANKMEHLSLEAPRTESKNKGFDLDDLLNNHNLLPVSERNNPKCDKIVDPFAGFY